MTPSLALSAYPVRLAETADGARVAYREAGAAAAATHVLLHGIGSASDSWVFQLQAAGALPGVKVLAWDAPGYGRSEPLSDPTPDAGAYAMRLWAWLDAVSERGPVSLVGHSLGALMAARAALLQPQRVRELILLSPARGYGNAPAAERAQKLSDRLALLERAGSRGMASERAAAMLSPAAPQCLIDAVRETMANIHVQGYMQAARMLDQGDLMADLRRVQRPVRVACGSADTITPPAACQAVAACVGQDRLDLGPVGHACPLEAADAVNALTGLAPSTISEGQP